MNKKMNNIVTLTDDIYLNSNQIGGEFENELLNYALHYAKTGYPVIPLHNLEMQYGIFQCSCKSLNCPSAGKHPRTWNGSNDATTDENKIIDWWDKYPNANIGLLAGMKSGFFVLDIDIKTDVENPYNGEETLEALQEDYKVLLGDNYTPLPSTLTAISGSGSRHLYFKYNFDLVTKNSQSKIGLGLDIKSDNNYIVAPPSNHKSGNKYQWFGVNTPIEDAPDWLHYEIQIAMQASSKLQKSVSEPNSKSNLNKNEKIPVTQRNTYLHKQICGLVNSFSKEEVLRRALEINVNKFTEPLEEIEIIRTVNWAWKRFVENKDRDIGLKT